VEEFDPVTGQGTGFRFGAYDPFHFSAAVLRALPYWKDKESWQRLMRNGMTRDFSWARSARRYAEVYERLLSR